MKLVDAGVDFEYKSIPKELLNDEEFILELAKKTNTDIRLSKLSERLRQDKDFLLKIFGKVKECYEMEEILIYCFKSSQDVLDYLNSTSDYLGNYGQAEVLLEEFNESEDVVKTIIEKYPSMARSKIIKGSARMVNIALGVFKKMPHNEDIKESIKCLEEIQNKTKSIKLSGL